MNESQIDWVNEINKETIKRTNLFDKKVGYEDAKLLRNAIITPDGTLIESRYRHHYNCHVDTLTKEAYFVDGGLDYDRGSYSGEGVKDLRIYDLDDHILIRERFTWGTYGKNMDKPLEYKLLKFMSDAHLVAILKTQKLATRIFNVFVDEVEYRNTNNLKVEDNYG